MHSSVSATAANTCPRGIGDSRSEGTHVCAALGRINDRQPLHLLNGDDILHNVNAKSTINKEFDGVMSASKNQMMVPGKVFAKSEVMIPFACNVHRWMLSYLGVGGHPFFAVSSAEDSYEIASLSAGTCELTVWHAMLAGDTQKVKIHDGAYTIDLVLNNKLRKNK